MTTNPMLAELDERLGELKKTLAIMAKYAPPPGVLCAPTMEMGLGWKAKSLLPSIEAAHATIADMAKRLEAAERDAGKCWALHFKGPDDVVAAPSKQAAELAAKNFNAIWDAHQGERGHDVRVVAAVIEWDHGYVEHAKCVIKHWPEYADLLDAATREGEG